MLRSLLIGLDGSAYSEAALSLGIRWAKQFDAVLVGLGIVDEPDIRRAEPVPIGGGYEKHLVDEAQMHNARIQVAQFLRQFKKRCGQEDVECRVLEEVGSPVEQIAWESQRCDVILLGQQTYFLFETQEGPCDTLIKLLRRTARPIVTVPQTVGAEGTVVIAYDASVQAARTLQAWQCLGLDGKQRIEVLSIHAERDQAQRCCDQAVEFLQSHGMQPQPVAIESSQSVADVILEHIERCDAQLLVMGTCGKSALYEVFMGSVTRSVLKRCPVPIFMYH
jgi:nucleotide-binding universal stress UspA family protein